MLSVILLDNISLLSFDSADYVFVYKSPQVNFDVEKDLQGCIVPWEVISDFDNLVATIVTKVEKPCAIVCMSNGSFNGIHAKILKKLQSTTL